MHCLALLFLCLITYTLSTPFYNDHFSSKYIHKTFSRRSQAISILDRATAIAAQTAARQKFRNAPALLAGHGTSPGYVIPSSLQHAYNRASDHATNITLLTYRPKPSTNSPSNFSSAVRLAGSRVLGTVNTTTNISLVDDTDDFDDFEYYGPLLFGSQGQVLEIDFDTGSADTWVPVNCSCGLIRSFQAGASTTYHDTGADFSVTYGSGYVIGTLAQDTITVGGLEVYNQYLGAVQNLSESFFESPNDGLSGLAFSAIANSRKPTLFENLIPQLPAPMFSFYMTRTQPHGSEVSFGGIDQSKVRGNSISWVEVISRTYWTVSMTGVSVNSLISTNVSTIIDTGTSFIYIPDDIVADIYDQIPGSAPASDYGDGFYSFPCDAQVSVSFVLGGKTLPLDPRDINIGQYTSDSRCIGAIIATGTIFGGEDMAILGDSFLKSYISIFDYSHGARVGFVESINE